MSEVCLAQNVEETTQGKGVRGVLHRTLRKQLKGKVSEVCVAQNVEETTQGKGVRGMCGTEL